MKRGQLIGMMQTFVSLHRGFEQADFAAQSRREAEERRWLIANATPSTQLGHGRLADASDLAAANLFDRRGLFLGALNGRMIFYNGDSHLITYARNGGGKGLTVILPNLAHVRDRSLVVIDVKDGENAFASSHHRSKTLGQKVIYLNPFGVQGLPNAQINPLHILVDTVGRGGKIDTEADEIALILIPMGKGEVGSGNAWVNSGARRLLALRMEYLALIMPEDCTLGGLWRFANSSTEAMTFYLTCMAECGEPGIEGRASAFLATLQTAEKQWEAYKSAVIDAVAPFQPGKALEVATSAHKFDFGALKKKPHTVYLITPSEKIGVASKWISLIANYAIETIARTVGPIRTTFIMDEFPQLPRAPAYLKVLRLYRGRGCQLWVFAQGRFSMEGQWSRDEVREFEDQAAIFQTWSVDEPTLIKDITLWSGTKTISAQSLNLGGGVVESAGAAMSERQRPVLQTEDIRSIGADMRQIIKVAGYPYLLVCDRVPYTAVDPWKHQIRDVRELHFNKYYNAPVILTFYINQT